MERDDFVTLSKRITPTLKAITRHLDGKYTFFNDDDLYQEALLAMWDKYRSGGLSDKTDSYVLQGCYFHLRNHIRTVWKKTDAYSSYMDDISPNVGDDDGTELRAEFPATSPERPFDEVHARLLRHDVMMRLNARERMVFSLLAEGMTVREIGEKLGISHVMVVKIKKHIEEKCHDLRNECLSHS